jgi:DNA-directed RNA polymerase subunit L
MRTLWNRIATLLVLAGLLINTAAFVSGCDNDSSFEEAAEETSEAVEEAGDEVEDAVEDATN